MLRIGEKNTLEVLSAEPHGLLLDGGSSGEVFLATSLRVDEAGPGDKLDVFVYRDNKQRLLATQQEAKASVGDVAYLKVVDINKIGAFLDWGLKKDLLVPFHEQLQPMQEGKSYLVMVFLDSQKRIAASAKLDEFIHDENEKKFRQGQEVNIIIGDKTDLGYKAVIENTHWGVLYDNEIFQRVRKGMAMKAFIKQVRDDDDRLDLSLRKVGYNPDSVGDLSQRIITAMQGNAGFLPLNDKSSPAEIASRFSVSKKQFKQAVGKLYKQRLIVIDDRGIRLVS